MSQNIVPILKEISKEYNQPIKVMIGTPCYGGMVTVDYLQSLLKTKTLFSQMGIELEIAFLSNESLIPRGRNTIVAKFLANKSCNFLMFIDADITWDPVEIIKLLVDRKHLIGGCYPKKKYNFNKLNEVLPVVQRHADYYYDGKINEELLKAKLTEYVMNHSPNTVREGHLMSLKHIGTGFMMISRKCLEEFKIHYSYLKYKDDHGVLSPEEDNELYAFFDTDIAEGHYLSEDYLFCKRWEDITNTSESPDHRVWVDLTVKLSHTGSHKFEGNYILSLANIDRNIAEDKKAKSELSPHLDSQQANKKLVEEINKEISDQEED